MAPHETSNPHDVESDWREMALRAKRARGEPLDPDASDFLRERDKEREEATDQAHREVDQSSFE